MRIASQHNFKQLAHAPLFTERISELIKKVILEGHYKPGQRLTEVELSEALGTSRGPIREAFQRLSKEGLICLVPRKGAFVKALKKREMIDLLEVRGCLEVLSVTLATERATKKDLDELLHLLTKTHSAIENRDYRNYPWNLDFHKQIAKCSKNEYLEVKISEVNAQLLLSRHRSGSEKGRAKESFAEHKMIFDAISRRDQNEALNLLENHLDKAKKNILKLLKTD